MRYGVLVMLAEAVAALLLDVPARPGSVERRQSCAEKRPGGG
jgi:hypothetical protein